MLRALCCFVIIAFSTLQTEAQDSLLNIWKSRTTTDSASLATLGKYCIRSIFERPDSARKWLLVLKDEAQKTKNNYWLGASYNLQGILQASTTSPDSAIASFQEAYSIFTALDDVKNKAKTLNNIGNVYRRKGEFNRAIDYFKRSADLSEAAGDSLSVAINRNNVGVLYKEMGLLDEALVNYRMAEKIYRNANNPRMLGDVKNNLGTIFKKKNEFDSALMYFNAAIELYQDKVKGPDAGNAHMNAADVLLHLGRKEDALEYARRGVALAEAGKDNASLSNSYSILGAIFMAQDRLDTALIVVQRGYDMAKGMNAAEYHMNCAERLSQIHLQMGDFQKAYEFQMESLAIREKMKGLNMAQEVARKEYQFELEKAALTDSLQREEQKKLFDSELEAKRQEQLLLYGALGLATIVVFLVFRGFIRKKRDHLLISEQKAIVEQKNLEITDSMNYAQRIQEAILPTNELMQSVFPRSFVLYQPKDIVAGDFYWLETYNNEVFFAVADCTGHGVPGAMVSVVCSNALSKAVLEEHISDPGKILHRTREVVIDKLSAGSLELQDGMDVSLLKWNPDTRKLSWAGANSPLWILRPGDEVIEEIKGDKQPVGSYVSMRAFTTHTVDISEGTHVYMTSDGYIDQFGGVKGKKLKSANMKKLITGLREQEMYDLGASLAEYLDQWKGELDQVDDICVAGIQL